MKLTEKYKGLAMATELTEWQRIKQRLNNLLINTPIDHLIIAHKAKMSLHEIFMCQEISDLKSIPIDHVFKKMALFKESSDHLLYKKDFAYNG
jgi:hypothetical protein